VRRNPQWSSHISVLAPAEQLVARAYERQVPSGGNGGIYERRRQSEVRIAGAQRGLDTAISLGQRSTLTGALTVYPRIPVHAHRSLTTVFATTREPPLLA
jgi:hypothetical protein